MKFKALAWVTLLLIAGGCAAQNPGEYAAYTEEVVLQTDRDRAAAMVEPEAARLDEVFHDDLTYSHSNGRVETKAELVERLVSGAIDYRILDSPEPSVWIDGSTAIVTGPTTVQVAAGERVFDLAGVYTAVYVNDRDRWRLVAYHSSPKRG